MKQFIFLALALTLTATACNDQPKTTAPSSPTASEISPAKADRGELMDFLQGRWQSDDDPTYVIEFSGATMRHMNDGQLTEETRIEIDPTCRNTVCGDSGGQEGWCFMEKMEGGDQCNRVIQGADGVLQYRAVGAVKDLSFKKIQ